MKRYWIKRNAKKILVALVGGFAVLAGFVMFFLPGPGLLVVLFGLSVLALEFAWAKNLLSRAKEFIQERKKRKKRT